MNQNTKMYSSLLKNIFNNSLKSLTDDKAIVKMALFNSGFKFNKEDDNYSQLKNEIEETKEYKAGGKELQNFRIEQRGKLLKLMSDGVNFSDSEIEASYGVVYNDTPENEEDKKLLACVEFEDKLSPTEDTDYRVYWENDCIFSFRDTPHYLTSELIDLMFDIDKYNEQELTSLLKDIILPSGDSTISNINQLPFPMFVLTREPKTLRAICKDKELTEYLFNSEVFVQYLTTNQEAMEIVSEYNNSLNKFFELPRYVGEGLSSYDDKIPALPMNEHIRELENIMTIFLDVNSINLLTAKSVGDEFLDYIDINIEDVEKILKLIGNSESAMNSLISATPMLVNVLESGIRHLLTKDIACNKLADSKKATNEFKDSENAIKQLSKSEFATKIFTNYHTPALTNLLLSDYIEDTLWSKEEISEIIWESGNVGYGYLDKGVNEEKTAWTIRFDEFDGEKYLEFKMDLTDVEKISYYSKNESPGFLREELIWVNDRKVYSYDILSEDFKEHTIDVSNFDGKQTVRIGGYCDNNQKFSVTYSNLELEK